MTALRVAVAGLAFVVVPWVLVLVGAYLLWLLVGTIRP